MLKQTSFVDILFSLMTLPLGTVVKLLEKLDDKRYNALGSLKNLYQSLKDFPENYFSTEECKYMLLNPRNVSHDHCQRLRLKLDDTASFEKFACVSCMYMNFSISICKKAKCTLCGKLMNCGPWPSISNVSVGGSGGVFVSDSATFIVTDNFSVMLYSAASIFQLLADSGITDSGPLEDRKLDLGLEQLLSLINLALLTESPLTSYIFFEDEEDDDYPLKRYFSHCKSIGYDDDGCDFMKKETSTSAKMAVQVSFQKSTGKFLFAEAKEDFVDFLFGFLSIPLGTVIGTLMKGTSYVCCMNNIFRSISNMSVGRYLKSQDIKNMLLQPPFGQEYLSKSMLFSLKSITTTIKIINSCNSFSLKDPRLNGQTIRSSGMFIVRDDLCITPSSPRLVINILNTLNVKFDDIKTFEISFGLEEGLEMLQAMLLSRSTFAKIIKHHLKK